MKVKIANEPITGQARELETLSLHVNLTYQETLLTKEGQEIMKGELKNFSLPGGAALPDTLEEDNSGKKQELISAIEKLVTQYLKAQ